MAGKGDKRIPSQISKEQFSVNWDRIWGKKDDSRQVSEKDLPRAEHSQVGEDGPAQSSDTKAT